MISTEVGSVVKRLFIKWKRSPMFMIGGLLSPLLYLLLFGQAFNLSALIPGSKGVVDVSAALFGAPSYFSYFAVGMMAFAAVSIAIFSGVNALFDKSLGITQRTVGTPARRSSIFTGYLVFQTILTMIPAFLVLLIALALDHVPGLDGITITQSISLLGMTELVATITLLSLSFTALFLAFGFMSKDQNTYFGLTAMLQLPILLTSNAMYPQSTMPIWLQHIVSVNPITMANNIIRENLFGSGMYPHSPFIYMLELTLWAVALICISLVIVRKSFYSEG